MADTGDRQTVIDWLIGFLY